MNRADIKNPLYTFPVDAVLLLGPTGAGKSPLGNFIGVHGLIKKAAHHLDFGSELRALVSGVLDTSQYNRDDLNFIQGVLERGLLLENEHFALAKKIIHGFLDRVGFSQNHVLILNGIPRHIGQAEDVSTLARIHAVIHLDCTADDVICRLSTNVGGDRTDRSDDEKALVAKKLSLFNERTTPLIEYYSGRKCPIFRIEAAAATTAQDSYRILSALAAAHPPIAFIAEPPQG